MWGLNSKMQILVKKLHRKQTFIKTQKPIIKAKFKAEN